MVRSSDRVRGGGFRRRRSGWRGGPGRAARAACPPRSAARNAPRRCSSGTSRSVIASGHAAMTPGRSRKPDSPAACQSSSRSASCAGVPVKTWRVAGVGGPGPLVQPLPAATAAARGLVEEHHQVGEDVHGLSAARPARPARPGSRPRSPAAWAASRGVTNPTSADRAISRYGTAACPSAATTGWPCGGRGVIDGPLTLKNQRPRSRCSAACRGR